MRTSTNGIKFIKDMEGIKLEAYQCPSGVWTIGVGHTGKVDGKKIVKGMKITVAQANSLLNSDILTFEKKVSRYDKKYHWNQNQFDALVSFAFNIGSIDQLTALGTRTIAVIANKIPLYNKSAGRVLEGLSRRRELERILFLK